MFKKPLLLFLFLIVNLYATASKEVLLIHSYHKGYKWSDDISKVFDNKFEQNRDYSLTTVYMDTKKVDTKEYLNRLYELYKEKFRQRKFDLILVADNNALDFVKKHYITLFKELPIVFLGINNFKESMLEENSIKDYATGVVESVDIKKNIDLILKIDPKLKKLVIINDRSNTGLAMKNDILEVLHEYKDRFSLEYIDDIEIESLKNRVKSLKRRSAILWVLMFKDSTGKYFTHKESLTQIRDVSNVPIYGLWDFYLGDGIVGGVLTSATAQAKYAYKIVDSILSGVDAKSIPILKTSPNKYMFDFNELQKYNIKIANNIKIHEEINRPFSFYAEYKFLVWITIFIMSIIVIILIFLVINVEKRKKIEFDLTNQLKFIAVLMDNIPSPMNYKNLKGQYVGCNKAFANLLGKKREEVIGKTIFDFFPKESAQEEEEKEKELLKNRLIENFEKIFHLPDGSSKVMNYHKTVYSNIDGTVGGIVSIMFDVTNREQKNQFMIQQSKLAEMGEMVAAIAHQWNEPLVELSAILQDIEFSYMEDEMNQNKMNELVKESMVQIQYMSQTLKDFRNFLKPSTRKDSFCAKKALEDILEIIGRQIFYSHINLSVTCKEDCANVFGYENEFKQVLLNIINNAKNKILDSKNGRDIEISICTKNEKVFIQIGNNGGKISDEVINYIFDPYFTTNKDGTGLGLYMAKVIIEDKMNGKITVSNSSDKVIFSIQVPSKEEVK